MLCVWLAVGIAPPTKATFESGFPVTIGTADKVVALIDAVNLAWVFFFNNSQFCYATSASGSSWSAPTVILDDAYDYGCNFTSYVSVAFDGSYFHYGIIGNFSDNNVIYYQRGTPAPTGSMDWAPLVVAYVNTTANYFLEWLDLEIDYHGYTWMSFLASDQPSSGLGYLVIIKGYEGGGGAWYMSSGFPLDLPQTTTNVWHTKIVPLTDGKMVEVGLSGYEAYGPLYFWTISNDGSSVLPADGNGSMTASANIYYEAVEANGYVHAVTKEQVGSYTFWDIKYDPTVAVNITAETNLGMLATAGENWVGITIDDYGLYLTLVDGGMIKGKVMNLTSSGWDATATYYTESHNIDSMVAFRYPYAGTIGLAYVTNGDLKFAEYVPTYLVEVGGIKIYTYVIMGTENITVPWLIVPVVQNASIVSSWPGILSTGWVGSIFARMYAGEGGWGQYAIIGLPILILLLAGRHSAAIAGVLATAVCIFVNVAAGASLFSIAVLGLIGFVCLLMFFEEGKSRGGG